MAEGVHSVPMKIKQKTDTQWLNKLCYKYLNYTIYLDMKFEPSSNTTRLSCLLAYYLIMFLCWAPIWNQIILQHMGEWLWIPDQSFQMIETEQKFAACCKLLTNFKDLKYTRKEWSNKWAYVSTLLNPIAVEIYNSVYRITVVISYLKRGSKVKFSFVMHSFSNR